jgi:hypothetical protein
MDLVLQILDPYFFDTFYSFAPVDALQDSTNWIRQGISIFFIFWVVKKKNEKQKDQIDPFSFFKIFLFNFDFNFQIEKSVTFFTYNPVKNFRFCP